MTEDNTSDKGSRNKAKSQAATGHMTAFRTKIEAAKGQIHKDDALVQTVVEKIDSVAASAADLLAIGFNLGVGEANLFSVSQMNTIAAEIADGFEELFKEAVKEALNLEGMTMTTISKFFKDADKPSPVTQGGFLGSVFSQIVLSSETQLAKDKKSVNVEATARLTALRKEILRRLCMNGLKKDKILQDLSKTVISFTTRVASAIQAAVAGAFQIPAATANDAVLKIINVESLNEQVMKLLEGPVGAIVKANLKFD